MLKVRQEIGDAFGGLTAYAYAAQAVVASIAVAVMVAWLAAFAALRARYSRRLLVAGSLLLLCGLALVLLARGTERGIAPAFLVGAIVTATGWIAVAAMVLATIYLFWSGFAERVLTIRYACGALVISAAFGGGYGLRERPAAGVVGILWLVLLILMVSVLAPWSLSRIRHA